MAFCGTCGAPVEGRFCAKCGTPAPASAPPPPNPAPPPQQQYTPPQQQYVPPQQQYVPPQQQYAPQPAAAGMTNEMASGMCYVLGLITGILFLVMEPYSKNRVVRFHAFQSIFMNVAWIAVYVALNIVLGVVGSALGFVSGFWAFGLISLVHTVVGLAFFGLWIYMLVMTFQGKTIVLPIIGPLAQKQA